MALSVDVSFANVVILASLVYVVKKAYQCYKIWKLQEMLEKWDLSPKDKVIYHGVPRGKNMPSISPFCLKLETYLRMAKIPYQYDGKDMFGPKGKSPWISINGIHIADTHLIIQFLNKKFGANLNSSLTPVQREIARSLSIMLENNFFWGLASWRWVEGISNLDQIMKFPTFVNVVMSFRSKGIEKTLNAQGLGRHCFSERTDVTITDLRTVSVILGDKSFIGGNEPCEYDCAVFGFVSQAVWAAPGSKYERIVEEELQNLKQYCNRMKDRFWPDWNNCLSF